MKIANKTIRKNQTQETTSLTSHIANCVFEEFVRLGLREVCIAPGSRSTWLTLAAANHPKLKTVVHVDERGLGFFALGIAKKTKRPVAIITTSGTAVANLLPAIVEAHYSSIPLIICSADRPPELHQTGANQTIKQENIGKPFIHFEFNFPPPDTTPSLDFYLSTIDQAYFTCQTSNPGPIQLNFQIREEFNPTPTQNGSNSFFKLFNSWSHSQNPLTTISSPKCTPQPIPLLKNKETKQLIFIAGQTEKNSDWDFLVKIAETNNIPIIADILSHLRFSNHTNIITYSDMIITHNPEEFTPDAIIIFGKMPISKKIQKWIKNLNIPIIQVSSNPNRDDPDHQLTQKIWLQYPEVIQSSLESQLPSLPSNWLEKWQQKSKNWQSLIQSSLSEVSELTEPWIHYQLPKQIPQPCQLFLSNSLPIRFANKYGTTSSHAIKTYANRGASGIDGIIATACGLAQSPPQKTILVIGDIAFTHDLNSLALVYKTQAPLLILLINNGGGDIFSYLPIHHHPTHFTEYFKTPQTIQFQKATEAFHLPYTLANSKESVQQAIQSFFSNPSPQIVECLIHPTENKICVETIDNVQD